MKGCSFIQGVGLVTPLGNRPDEVWDRLTASERAEVKLLQHRDRSYPFVPVPPAQVAELGKNPRLRRSSAISYFAASAGLSALANAGIDIQAVDPSKLALILAISSGGVTYTRRFYDTIVEKGANAASPLLFPETVYNAPGSHLAALIGIDGMSYTLVGDSSVGISAIKYAEQLLATTDIEHCLVVGSEEVDWVLCEAYREWRLATAEKGVSIYHPYPAGALLGEGAAGLVIGRHGMHRLSFVHDGVPFFQRSGAAASLCKVFTDVAEAVSPPDLVIGAANGSSLDAAEASALLRVFPSTPIYCPKPSLGDALGASSLIQTVLAFAALERQAVPPTLGCESAPHNLRLIAASGSRMPMRSVLVSSLGFNFQASGLVVTLNA